MTVRVEPMSSATAGSHAVVVFPHAGGSPRYYAAWRRHLPPGIDLYGVTYPGRDALLDEPPPGTLVALASECAAACTPIVRSSASLVMFGHSMGAYVAFEATRTLERSGIPLSALVVSGVDAPHSGIEQAWHRAGDEDLVRHLGELDVRTREALAVPELRQMFLPAIRDDLRLVETYSAEPKPQLSCPIHILYGESDPDVSESKARAWSAYTRADSLLKSFPGDHFYLDGHSAQVVAHLSGLVHSRIRARPIL